MSKQYSQDEIEVFEALNMSNFEERWEDMYQVYRGTKAVSDALGIYPTKAGEALDKDIIGRKADAVIDSLIWLSKAQQIRITELESITDEKVERVARAIMKEFDPDFSEGTKHYYQLAKAALEAALGGDDVSSN